MEHKTLASEKARKREDASLLEERKMQTMEHKTLAWEKARKREDSSLLEERIQLSKLEPKGQL